MWPCERPATFFPEIRVFISLYFLYEFWEHIPEGKFHTSNTVRRNLITTSVNTAYFMKFVDTLLEHPKDVCSLLWLLAFHPLTSDTSAAAHPSFISSTQLKPLPD